MDRPEEFPGEAFPLAANFPAADEAAWRAAVDRVLAKNPKAGNKALSPEERKAAFQRSMTSRTYDGITIKGLYSRRNTSDLPASGFPGFAPFVRGATAAGPISSGWDIRQRVDVNGNSTAAAEAVMDELQNGATSLWLSFAETPDAAGLDRVLRDVMLDLASVILDGNADISATAAAMTDLWKIRKADPQTVKGSFGLDPIGTAASAGTSIPADASGKTVELARSCVERYPGVWAIVVDATRYHDAGASDCDEIACATAAGVEYLRWLTEGGLPLEAAASQIEFRFAATDNQFMAIAKLRAARRLWNRVAVASGASQQIRGQRQHAVTSRAMITQYDPMVNMLRSTIACLAAGIGGADSITVTPHDYAGTERTELGRRMARNTQTILIEEAHMARVIDPAGGSWFVDALTDEVARTAWKNFQAIEAAGGLIKALELGTVQEGIAATSLARMKNLARRRDPLTGVSEFPNISEPPRTSTKQSGSKGLPVIRYAQAFEELRLRSDRAFLETGKRPAVFLANLGPLSEHTVRATFCKNLYEAGGIVAIPSSTVSPETAGEAFRQSGARLACICGDNTRYAAEAEAVALALAEQKPARIYLAGDPGALKDALQNAGVNEFVIAGGDVVALLNGALKALGVSE